MITLITYKITETPKRKTNDIFAIYCCRIEENGSEISTRYYSSELDRLTERLKIDQALAENPDQCNLQNSQTPFSNKSHFIRSPLSDQEFDQFKRRLFTH